MKIIKPYFIIEDSIDGEKILKRIEKAGRTAYKSEHKITPDSAKKFVKMVLDLGHESVIEHEKVTIRVICDRGVSHELVRHRIASFTQESTRFCNYSKGRFGNEITVIKPCFWNDDSKEYKIWKNAMENAEKTYMELIKLGAKPEEARSVLPNSLKTEIVITMNLREIRWMLNLRCSPRAHPQMREIMIPLLIELHKKNPIIFDDLYKKYIDKCHEKTF